MRYRFEPQLKLGLIPIQDVVFNISSRHEMVPILMALQHLYNNSQDTLNSILELIENDIGRPQNPKRGCKGMSIWEILVLASIRLGSEMDYDLLANLASNHRTLRQMMMISDWDNKSFSRSAVHENLYKIKPETIQKIDDLIIIEGHELSDDPLKRVRGDSFVMQKNIHYPTDSNVLLDGCRKVINISKKISDFYDIPGWRKSKYLKKELKSTYRNLVKVAQSKAKDRDQRLKACYTVILEKARQIISKALNTLSILNSRIQSGEIVLIPKWQGYVSDLQYYIGGTEYIIDLAYRRVFLKETIANVDKVFSLFEPDTELINRGKRPNPIEFGHRVFVVQDNAGFILHNEVMGIGITDEKVITKSMKNLQDKYHGKIDAASFDKGFWKPDNLSDLSEFIKLVVLPKKGKHTDSDRERESAKAFGEIRKWHSGIESAIGALQSGNGLKVCRDKGIDGYKRYLAMAVLGRNLHVLGNKLIEKERKKRNKQKGLLDLLLAS